MNAQEAAILCRYVAACCPQQKIDEFTPTVWADLLIDVRLEDAKEAVRTVLGKQPFIAPAEIIGQVRRVRAKRIAEGEGHLTPPADAREGDAHREWLADAKRRLGDGELAQEINPLPLDLKPRHLPDIRALMPAPDKETPMPPKNVCPECAQGKHINCDGQAFDDDSDAVVECGCARTEHEAEL
jgi:hypothetical protein